MDPNEDDLCDIEGNEDIQKQDNDETVVESFDENEDLPNQLRQVETAVTDMRDVFTSALSALKTMQNDDEQLQQKVDDHKKEHERQLSQVVRMVLSLKNDFGAVLHQLTIESHVQRNLRQQVSALQSDRQLLLEELHRAGAISDSLYEEHNACESSEESDQEPLSLLLRKARMVFGISLSCKSEEDSGVTTTDSSVSPESPRSVNQENSYIVTLPPPPSPVDDVEASAYDSDSSITAAANKSLDLSRSLGDNCLEVTAIELSSDEEDTRKDTEKEEMKKHTPPVSPRTDADGAARSPFRKPTTPVRKVPPHERRIKQIQRNNVAQELYETEKKYCNNLWILLDHFAEPIRKSEVISSKELSTMLPQVLITLYQSHCTILQKLEDRVSHSSNYKGMFGDIFARFIADTDGELFQHYQKYVREFPDAILQIKKSCRTCPKFRKFLRQQLDDPVCEGLDLGSFLLTPVQRIPRYVLLLKQMLKCTEEDHPDHYQLQLSLHKLAAFLTQLNESIQYSMKLVSQVAQSPKLKRKTSRSSSFRSSNSSVESMKLAASNTVQKITNVARNVSFREGRHTPRLGSRPSSTVSTDTPNKLKQKLGYLATPSVPLKSPSVTVDPGPNSFSANDEVVAGNFSRRIRKSISQSDVRLASAFNDSSNIGENTLVSQSQMDVSASSKKRHRFPLMPWTKSATMCNNDSLTSNGKRKKGKQRHLIDSSIASEADVSLLKKKNGIKGSIRSFFKISKDNKPPIAPRAKKVLKQS
ncbi:DgyrCDS7914 [Dimorphilus gyrociliatus]|uniref:DgyrCDS7914 n=1 Tax=Dimorphilus gyrociliatus TaxID=2664684 RepID=A0A7I8VTL4_9ANNE|nr:DgyrCDS7914 [Dimorphilus gyrociliatus]